MLYAPGARQDYAQPACHEVICQLTFPAILTINRDEPVDFQESLRAAFPRYARMEEKNKVVNYHFVTGDGQEKLNLTRDFISLSTLRYGGWERFAGMLDRPLASFIRLYQPAYFSRIGLRYVNFISRKRLGLEDTPWAELIAGPYLSVLGEEDCPEESVAQLSLDHILRPEPDLAAHIRAGLARLRPKTPNTPEDPELRFLLDIDVYAQGSLPCTQSAALLTRLHNTASALFEGAITEELRKAMR